MTKTNDDRIGARSGPSWSDPAQPSPASVATLDRFIEASASRAGVSLLSLEPLTMLRVQTRNSVYRIVVARGCAVFVQGGRFFPRLMPARLTGATFGGSVLKLAWIGVGMQMEIADERGPIVTSPVQQISVEGFAARQVH